MKSSTLNKNIGPKLSKFKQCTKTRPNELSLTITPSISLKELEGTVNQPFCRIVKA